MLNIGNDINNAIGARPTQSEDNSRISQQEYFRLMIAQLQNQNPTSPQDGTQYLTQIAQFGTVNGIEELQQSFALLANSLSSNQALSAANLVEREVLLPGGFGYLEAEGEINASVDLPQQTNQLVVQVKNESGETIRTLHLGDRGAGSSNFTWDGLTDDGEQAPQGRYSMTAEAVYGGQPIGVETLVAGRVESVSFGGFAGQTVVSVAGLGPVSLADVRGIR